MSASSSPKCEDGRLPPPSRPTPSLSAADDGMHAPNKPNVWGKFSTTSSSIESNKKQINATFADIMAEQETEKMNKETSSKNSKVCFSNDVENEEERMMRLAIEASLRDQQEQESHQFDQKINNSQVSFSDSNDVTHHYNDEDDIDDDLKMAIALSLGDSSSVNTISKGPNNIYDIESVSSDDRKPSSTEAIQDESEKLANALHQADIEENNASHASHDAEGEAASLALAMQLQREEDARHLNNMTIENDARAAQLKREELCRGGANVGTIGIRTVDREEFQRMQSAKVDKGYGTTRISDRRREEERGMGKLLNTKHYDDFVTTDNVGDIPPRDDSENYYYYASDRLHADDEDGDHYDYEEDFGIKMNSQSLSSKWQRLDKDTFIGPDNEIRSKHDLELKHKSNAINLLDGAGAGGNTTIGDRAYNAFRRSEQRGTKKGVLKHGTGRAENMNAAKTRGGAMDGNVRLQIAAAVNAGLIERCNGVVKEGKEGLVYHAESGRNSRTGLDSSDSTPEIDSDGYDVAVKVFKRIAEFKNRSDYVDGDPRYVKQKFKTNDAREHVVLWTEKEYRNLLRAHRGGIAVPKPLYQKENILFMRFLGESGWPSPQLREIQMKKGSTRWATLYCQTLVAMRRLYHCARLIHGDLSEYNILICPRWQVKQGPLEREEGDEDLQVVLIDFGQAVEITHPAAQYYLSRDLSTVTQFFANQAIDTLTVPTAEEFVVEARREETRDENYDYSCGEEAEEELKKPGNWRNIADTWNEKIDMEVLVAKLESMKK
jgi:serine/threonine-protein kinase RIO1